MPKTPLLAETLDHLSALNDQLRFMTFADKEIEAILTPLVARSPHVFTTDAFPTNSSAARIHVRLHDLEAFRRSALGTGFGAIVVASYEALVGYMEQAQRLLEALGRIRPAVTRLETPEETFQAVLNASNATPLDREVCETLAYLRLRRNLISHPRGDELSNALATLIRQRGTHLNRFWGNTAAVDFAAPSSSTLSEAEAVELLKLLRVLPGIMDAAVASALDPTKVVKSLETDLLDAQPYLSDPTRYNDRMRKLDTVAEMLYGLNVDSRTILSAHWSVPPCGGRVLARLLRSVLTLGACVE